MTVDNSYFSSFAKTEDSSKVMFQVFSTSLCSAVTSDTNVKNIKITNIYVTSDAKQPNTALWYEFNLVQRSDLGKRS